MKISVKGINLHVQQYGQGEVALVYLHYYGGSSRTWEGVTKALSDGFRIVAIDHRGWGQSDAPASGYSIADLAADAEGVIATLGLKRYVLIGHSMGGKVAQLIASRRPTGLEGLVLVAPAPPSPVPLSAEQRAILCSAYQSRESIAFVLDNVLTAKPLSDVLREQIIEDSLRGSPQAKSAWPNEAISEDISAAVRFINVPVRVISGECDRVDPFATLQEKLIPHISHAAIHIIPGAGHLLPLESPAEVAQIIQRFVASINEGRDTSI